MTHIAVPDSLAVGLSTGQLLAAWGPRHVLDEVERSRENGFRRPQDASDFRASRILARVVAAAALGAAVSDIVIRQTCAVCGGPHGKPLIEGSDLWLSISRTGGYVAAAAGFGPTAVDVER